MTDPRLQSTLDKILAHLREQALIGGAYGEAYKKITGATEMKSQNVIITKDDPQWLQDLAARAGYKTKDTKPEPGPLFTDGRAGLADALHKSSDDFDLALANGKARAHNKNYGGR